MNFTNCCVGGRWDSLPLKWILLLRSEMFTMKAWNKETNPTFRPCFIEVSVDRSVYTGCFDSLDFSQFLYSSFLTEINVRESPSVRKREPYSCNKNVKLLRCANISQGFKKTRTCNSTCIWKIHDRGYGMATRKCQFCFRVVKQYEQLTSAASEQNVDLQALM